ncbi:MAG: hypothetical protein EA379_11200 [Phycisphaerales bacterium]|nr:MAG: hypothetical protein EA379_11200 [Phycisphaerales bacterium]
MPTPSTQPPAPGAEMPRTYRPSDHETRIRAAWDERGAFRADPARVDRATAPTHEPGAPRPPYAVVIPPPNVTAALHLGHALNNTLQDVLVRVHRMMGYETLWMPGTDHAGIATQTVVERRLIKDEGKRRTDYPREEFVARVQAFKDEYEAIITDQLKKMGCSCDWSRQRFTMDDICARAVREAFFMLFKEGLIYRGKRLVNWDPVTQTALADDEVEMKEVDGFFYYLRYPLIHKPKDFKEPQNVEFVTWSELAARGYPDVEDKPGDKPAYITVATTRPETCLGDTGVAVNPKDPRAPSLRGLWVQLPLVKRPIRIVEDDYVVLPAHMQADPEAAAKDPKAQYATGFLKVTPAHDVNDYEIGRRHDLDVINVMAPDASISDQHGWPPEDVNGAHVFVGKSREDARKLVVKEFEARGLLEDKKPYRHSVGHSYRSHAAIEPYLSDQWYVKVTDDRLVGSAQRALSSPLPPTPPSGTGVPPVSSKPTPPRGTGVPPVFSKPTPPSGTGVPPVSSQSPSSSPTPTSKGIPDALTIHRRNLPHWQKGGSAYFVTFRLATSTLTDAERRTVMDACAHWHGDRARIHLITVMPDHVHMILSPVERSPGEWWSLQEIIHSVKSFSAHEIQKLRGESGPLWQTEYFDRLLRDADEFVEKWNYMLNNPVKARLCEKPGDYPFTCSPDRECEKGREGVGDGRDARPTSLGRADCESDAGDGALRFTPERYAKSYTNWHDNIRDWCISRQLWWGHRIPVWSIESINFIKLPVEEFLTKLDAFRGTDPRHSRIAANSLDSASYREAAHLPSELGEDPSQFYAIAVRDTSDREVIDFLESAGFTQDPDVLDTWFSSALWPLSTLGWPDPEQSVDTRGLLSAFNPTDVLCTAREIITLWVSRMVMFNRYLLGRGDEASFQPGPVPFRDVFIHAMIQDGEGRKMSKSLGNGVDPLDIIESHGADAMRFTLCHMTTQTQDVRMPVELDPTTGKNSSPKFDLGRNFCNKLWNASRFAISILEAAPSEETGADADASAALADRWMLSRLRASAETIDSALRNYEFSVYAQTVYDLLWRDFCDWHLEAIKPTVRESAAQRAVLRASLDAILRLLHPIAPFITEAIHERLRTLLAPAVRGLHLPESDMLCLAPWPQADESLRDEHAEREFDRLRDLIGVVREARSLQNVPPKRRITLHLDGAGAPDLLALAQRERILVETLAGLETIEGTLPGAGVAATALAFEGREHALSNLTDALDTGAERERLEKKMADLDKSIGALESRLNNPGYANRAPPNLVQQTRDQLESAVKERDATRGALERLS